MALASTLCTLIKSASPLRTDWLYSSAWSCRTGKRMESSFLLIRAGLTIFVLKFERPALKWICTKKKKKKFNNMLNKSLEQGLNLSGS